MVRVHARSRLKHDFEPAPADAVDATVSFHSRFLVAKGAQQKHGLLLLDAPATAEVLAVEPIWMHGALTGGCGLLSGEVSVEQIAEALYLLSR